jgi:hypothetical protein
MWRGSAAEITWVVGLNRVNATWWWGSKWNLVRATFVGGQAQSFGAGAQPAHAPPPLVTPLRSILEILSTPDRWYSYSFCLTLF